MPLLIVFNYWLKCYCNINKQSINNENIPCKCHKQKCQTFHRFWLGLTVPCSPLLCPSGLHSAKGLHDFVSAFAKMLVGSAEPAWLLLMTRVWPKALSRSDQEMLSPMQDLAVIYCSCVMIRGINLLPNCGHCVILMVWKSKEGEIMHVMPSHAVPCYPMPSHAMVCNAIPSHSTSCCATPNHTTPCHAMPHTTSYHSTPHHVKPYHTIHSHLHW